MSAGTFSVQSKVLCAFGASRGEGWKIEGVTLTLLGATCGRALAGEGLGVVVEEGCP